MSYKKDETNPSKREYTLEEALDVVGSGLYTNLLALTGGVMTLAAMATTQSMYFVLPAVRCELALGNAELGILGSIGFFGAMASASMFGFLVDMLGRRKILLITTIGTSACAIIGCFSPNTPTLMTFIFFTGFMLGGVFGNPYVYIGEFCAPSIRSKKLIIVAMVASLSNTFSPCAAWLMMWLDISVPIGGFLTFTSWRLFLIVNTLPMVISAVFLFFLPESPKYLLSKGRDAEAIQALSRVYALNHGLPKETFPVVRLRLDVDDTMGAANSKNSGGFINFLCSMYNQIKELFTPPLLIYTLICSAMKFAVIGLYSVIYLWLPEEANKLLKYSQSHVDYDVSLCDVMGTDGYNKWEKCETDAETYVVSICVGLIYSVLCLVMVYLVRIVQLKIILGCNIMVTALICFVMLFFRTLIPTLTSLGLMIAILAATQPAVYATVVHFFPTPLRATATAVCVVFGRLAVPIGSALFGAAFHSHCTLAYWSLAGILAIVAVICFLTPKKKEHSAGSP